jgi:apolipoprotein D and lipocalin family protein
MNPIQLPSIVLSFPFIFMLMAGCSVSKEMSTEFIPTVKTFDLHRFLGTWYEVARLPHSFENGLEKVTATYTLQNDGKIAVLNKGFDRTKGEWKEAKGKARFKDNVPGSFLEVSFFWIFYADYKIIDLDTLNYSYAMVTSSSKEYLWILSRTPQVEDSMYDGLIRKAGEWGFNVAAIYKVQQE